MDGIEKQWDVATTLPRMFRRSDDDGDFWNRIVPTKVKYDPDLAGLVFQCCRGVYDNLPVQFLKMLWMDPHCPWRAHRNLLLLATAKRIGGAATGVRIFLSPTKMKADRDLVRAGFANCPQALHAERRNRQQQRGRAAGLPARRGHAEGAPVFEGGRGTTGPTRAAGRGGSTTTLPRSCGTTRP
jgi:hypothetical protein